MGHLTRLQSFMVVGIMPMEVASHFGVANLFAAKKDGGLRP